jgi:hypothetical protein
MDLCQLLLAATPLLVQPLPTPPILDGATLGSLIAHLGAESDAERLMILLQANPPEDERARPDQGGQRITEEWLNSLAPRDCRWRFR